MPENPRKEDPNVTTPGTPNGDAEADWSTFIEKLERGNLCPAMSGSVQTRLEVNGFDRVLTSLRRTIGQAQHAASTLPKLETGLLQASRGLNETSAQQVAALAETTRRIHAINARCDEIGQVIEVLDDLARQTHVLALNAALEASRAGEQGKGFSMVAEQILKLAERSASATKDVAAFIQTIEVTGQEAGRTIDEVSHITREQGAHAASLKSTTESLSRATEGLRKHLDALTVQAPETSALDRLDAESRQRLVAVLAPILEQMDSSQHRPIDSTQLETALAAFMRALGPKA